MRIQRDESPIRTFDSPSPASNGKRLEQGRVDGDSTGAASSEHSLVDQQDLMIEHSLLDGEDLVYDASRSSLSHSYRNEPIKPGKLF